MRSEAFQCGTRVFLLLMPEEDGQRATTQEVGKKKGRQVLLQRKRLTKGRVVTIPLPRCSCNISLGTPGSICSRCSGAIPDEYEAMLINAYNDKKKGQKSEKVQSSSEQQ